MEFMIDVGFAVLFGLLRKKRDLPTWERAFRKLFTTIGLAYGWMHCPPQDTELPLDLVKP